MAATYKRPPITEAVIELRLADELSSNDLDAVCKRYSKQYPLHDELQNLELHFEISDPSKVNTRATDAGSFQRYSDLDRVNMVIVSRSTFAVARLAPYENWNQLRNRGEEEWNIFRKLSTRRSVARIGVRFINRFDIPAEPGTQIELEDYFLIAPRMPATEVGALAQFALHLEVPLSADDIGATINFTSVPSPLVSHFSFVLDVDLGRTAGIPGRPDALWATVDLFQAQKNRIFEGCVTDAMRALLNR